MFLYGKRNFAGLLNKSRLLRWGIARWPNGINHKTPLDEGCRRVGEGNVMTEAEIGVMFSEDGGRGQKPRNAGGHQKLKKARNWILSRRNGPY